LPRCGALRGIACRRSSSTPPRRTGLGYAPAGDYAATVADEVERLASGRAAGGHLDDDFFASCFDYAAEDRFLAART
jgi:hypothetical protein